MNREAVQMTQMNREAVQMTQMNRDAVQMTQMNSILQAMRPRDTRCFALGSRSQRLNVGPNAYAELQSIFILELVVTATVARVWHEHISHTRDDTEGPRPSAFFADDALSTLLLTSYA
eukprot:gene6194-2813_t